MQPGTVTPVLPQIWALPQLLSEDVLQLDYVSTNTGLIDKYIIFNPQLLLKQANYIVGDFSK